MIRSPLHYWLAAVSIFRHEQWNIGLVHAPIHSFLEPETLPPIEWLPPLGSEEYRADPFGIARDGRIYLFYELFDYRSFRGKLHCVELSGNESTYVSSEIIHIPCHASYPFIFEYKGEVYCVPETTSANKIVIYIAENFPYKWQYAKTLVYNFAGVDPTIVEHNGLWYLFCGAGDSGHDLYIWYAEDPLGVWQSHPKNPVKSGDWRSRPAGTPFVYQGNLYRPAQDGTKTYGGGIVIYKVACLSPDEFNEQAETTITPRSKWIYSDGLHTLSAVGNVTLIDAKRYVFSVGGLKHHARKRGRKLAGKLRTKLSRLFSRSLKPN